MLGNKEKDKIVKRYGNYYWEQIKKLSESYYKDIEERAREIEEKDQRIAELEKQLEEKDKEEVVITERGWAGHFCASDHCKFRRNTLIEYKDKKWVVSTVGAMPAKKYSFNKNENGFSTIGFERYYETMAFEAQKNGIYWDANVKKQIDFDSNWALDECDFNSDQKANEMHDKVVKELIKKIKGE